MATFDSTVNSVVSPVLGNDYVSAVLSILLVSYASVVAPNLPPEVLRFFDNPIAKFVVFFLIALTAGNRPTVALVGALAVMATYLALNRWRSVEQYRGAY